MGSLYPYSCLGSLYVCSEVSLVCMLKGVNTPPVSFHQRCKFVPIGAMSLIPSGHQGKVLDPACHVRVFALFVRTTIDPRDAGNALFFAAFIFAQLNVVGFSVWVLRTRKTPWSPKFAIPENIQLKMCKLIHAICSMPTWPEPDKPSPGLP